MLPGGLLGDEHPPSVSLGGLMFGDLYYGPSNHEEPGDGAAGAVLRRGYLTFDTSLDENWFGRLRFELNQSGEFETYTFKSQLKDLYLGTRLGRQRLLFGLSPTPTFDLIESIWGFRFLARTPMDLQGVASRDTGIAARGPLNESGSIRYRAMLAAAVEIGSDSDSGKRWMAALTWKPSPRWTIDLYTDKEWGNAPANRSTYQVFAAYESANYRWGAQYSNQNRQEDPSLVLASLFAARQLSENTSLVGRVDRLFKPSPKGNDIAYLPFDPSARATMFIGGIEFQLNPHFSITPNTVVTLYDHNDEGIRPKTDVYLRLTFFLDFE